jgi:hypothetical protein
MLFILISLCLAVFAAGLQLRAVARGFETLQLQTEFEGVGVCEALAFTLLDSTGPRCSLRAPRHSHRADGEGSYIGLSPLERLQLRLQSFGAGDPTGAVTAYSSLTGVGLDCTVFPAVQCEIPAAVPSSCQAAFARCEEKAAAELAQEWAIRRQVEEDLRLEDELEGVQGWIEARDARTPLWLTRGLTPGNRQQPVKSRRKAIKLARQLKEAELN